jgi:Cu(I)/Ag(I) efflux system membrane fusion protein
MKYIVLILSLFFIIEIHADNHNLKNNSIDLIENNKSYICPMHSNITSDKKDSCSICGMFLVPIKKDNSVKSPVFKENNHNNHGHAKKTNTLIDKISYICPMHPQITSDENGSCPICGMNLEPKNNKTNNTSNIIVSGNMQQSLAMRTEFAIKGDMYKELKTVGEIGYNEWVQNHVHPRVHGWIKETNVSSIGDKITKGQLLYTVYSPDILVAQQDYILALDTKISNKERLITGAETRLTLLGVSLNEINEIKKTKKYKINIPIYSEYNGTVTNINLKRGMYIDNITEVLTITDLSYVWISAYIFESEQNWVKKGQSVLISSNFMKNDTKSIIDYIYPELEPTTRSLKVRMVVKNHGNLRPKMLVNVNIYGEPKHDVLTIPEESLIQTGKNNRVVIKNNNGSFSSKEVIVGEHSNGKVEIISGIKEGDEVVISGQFLIDSESSIQNSLLRIVGK